MIIPPVELNQNGIRQFNRLWKKPLKIKIAMDIGKSRPCDTKNIFINQLWLSGSKFKRSNL